MRPTDTGLGCPQFGTGGQGLTRHQLQIFNRHLARESPFQRSGESSRETGNSHQLLPGSPECRLGLTALDFDLVELNFRLQDFRR